MRDAVEAAVYRADWHIEAPVLHDGLHAFEGSQQVTADYRWDNSGPRPAITAELGFTSEAAGYEHKDHSYDGLALAAAVVATAFTALTIWLRNDSVADHLHSRSG
jgi:hypothetical protein